MGQIGEANWTALCVARHVNVVTVVGGLFRCHLPRWPALNRLIAESGRKKPSPTPAFIRIARLIFVMDAWSKIIGDFITVHFAPVALREGILYVRIPALHYELEQISKPEILRRVKQRFGGKTICDVRFRLDWRGALTRTSCWSVTRICSTVRNRYYRSYVRQANKSEKKSHASKKAEKPQPEEIAPKRVNARYVVETNA